MALVYGGRVADYYLAGSVQAARCKRLVLGTAAFSTVIGPFNGRSGVVCLWACSPYGPFDQLSGGAMGQLGHGAYRATRLAAVTPSVCWSSALVGV